MTFIVIPHGEGPHSFEVTYRRIWSLLLVALVLVAVFAAMAVSYAFVAAQAGRVPALQAQIRDLEKDRVRVEQLARTLARMEVEYQKVRTILGADTAATDRAPAAADSAEEGQPDDAEDDSAAVSTRAPTTWPLSTRGYVTRGHLAAVRGRHPGIDIAVAAGSRVLAAGGGVVAEVGEDSVYGRFVRVVHPGGYESLYAHASTILVRPRQRVAPGEAIALSGSTGVSTAPHLHFEIRKDGRPLDPARMISNPD